MTTGDVLYILLSGLAQIHQLGVTSALDSGHVYSRGVCVGVCNVHFSKADCALEKCYTVISQSG